MNWDRIEGNWKQAKGKAKEQCGKLTIKTQGDTTFEASGNLELKAQGNLTISGLATTVEGQASVKVKGPLVGLAGNTQFSPS